MRQLRTALWLILLTAVTVKVVWWVVAPMLPFVLVGLLLVWIYGWILYRRRW